MSNDDVVGTGVSNQEDYKGSSGNAYFKGKTFIPKWLADEIMAAYHLMTMKDTDEIFVYRDGVYRNDGTQVIESVAQARLGASSSNRVVKETLGHIRRATRCTRSEFDADVNIINLDNGLFHIDEMKLFPHTPEHLSLQKSPITYDQEATCPTITWFLKDVLQAGDILFILEMFGYALMKQKRLNTAVFLDGRGRNGKSTMIDLLTTFVGSHLCSEITPMQMGGDDRFAIAELYGMLLNKVDDLGDATLTDLGPFKSVVGSKSVRGERKFEKAFSFTPRVLCVFGCNDVPQSNDMSEGFLSRARIVSFLKQFVGDGEILGLIDNLTTKSELSGLFNIAIVAAKDAVERGEFSGGKTIDDKRQEYIHASNSFALFIDELCDVSDPDDYVPKQEIYNQYVLWSRDKGVPVKDVGKMTSYFSSVGITQRRLTIDDERVYVYSGINMKACGSTDWF